MDARCTETEIKHFFHIKSLKNTIKEEKKKFSLA